jgi:hypothetical protein
MTDWSRTLALRRERTRDGLTPFILSIDWVLRPGDLRERAAARLPPQGAAGGRGCRPAVDHDAPIARPCSVCLRAQCRFFLFVLFVLTTMDSPRRRRVRRGASANAPSFQRTLRLCGESNFIAAGWASSQWPWSRRGGNEWNPRPAKLRGRSHGAVDQKTESRIQKTGLARETRDTRNPKLMVQSRGMSPKR